jgi:uncharacterized protein (TIGR02302 family)
MAVETEQSAPSHLSRKLWLARAATHATIIAERLLPRLLPLAGVLALFAILSWFGLFRTTGDMVRIVLASLFGFAALVSLWPLRRVRLPGPRDVDRRIERENVLAHAPITTQEDKLSAGTDDAFASVLWREHQRRMAESVDGVHGANAKTDIPARDPYALRAAIALLAVIAFAWSFGSGGGRLGDAFRSHQVAEAVPARIDAWITPPAYTGLAPIFLTSEQNASRSGFTVPEGSIAVVRIAGGTGQESVTWPEPQTPLGTKAEEGSTKPAASRRFEVTLEESGQLSVSGGPEDTLRDWTFAVTPDDAPTIAFLKDPIRAANGAMTVEYRTLDDYRVAKARGLIDLADEPGEGAHPLYDAPDLPLSLPRRSAEEGAAKTVRDLGEHPWAGARVTMTLEAEDDRGQTGRSETRTFILPGRPFSNPLSRAIIEQRRNLALDANAVPEIVDVLDVLTLYPEETINNASHFLGLVTARSRLLEAEGSDEALRGVVDYMWELARVIEDGNLSDAERRLQAAQQALKEALENGASDEEIEQLMAELREAMQDYLSELARQMENNPNMAQQMPENMQEMDMQSLQEMLDKIEELAKSGAREQAQQLLSELQNMMNNMQMGQHRRQQGDRQNQAQQQMNELGEILRRQQELMNETYRQNRRGEGQQQGQQQPGQQPGQQEGQGQQGQMGENDGQGQGLQGLAPGQQALRDRLEQFMDGLRGMGINPGDEFGEAGRSMGEAGQSLQEGEGEQAFSDQGAAMDALRRGADNMMQQMQQAMDGGTGATEPGGNRNALDRDPLGRPQRSAGPDFGESVEIPDEIDIRRAREILEAIRKRLGNALSPQLEKEYLERLLELN